MVRRVSLSFLLAVFLTILIPSQLVRAQIDPHMTVILSSDSISFYVCGPPGRFDAQQAVEVNVRSGYEDWTLSCEVSSLKGDTGEIPSSRIFVSSPFTDPNIDQGAGPGYEGLDKPRLAARGSFTGPLAIKVSTLKFRLLTTWEDRPGTYTGVIRFTYLVKP